MTTLNNISNKLRKTHNYEKYASTKTTTIKNLQLSNSGVVKITIGRNSGEVNEYEIDTRNGKAKGTYYENTAKHTHQIMHSGTLYEPKGNAVSEYYDIVASMAEMLEEAGKTNHPAYQVLLSELKNVPPVKINGSIYLRKENGLVDKHTLISSGHGGVKVETYITGLYIKESHIPGRREYISPDNPATHLRQGSAYLDSTKISHDQSLIELIVNESACVEDLEKF